MTSRNTLKPGGFAGIAASRRGGRVVEGAPLLREATAPIDQRDSAPMCQPRAKPTIFRCDVCGQFVAMSKAVRNLITPLSEFTREEFETLCEEHGGLLPTSDYKGST